MSQEEQQKKQRTIEQLYNVFGGEEKVSRSVIKQVVDENPEFNTAVDALLNMTNDPTGRNLEDEEEEEKPNLPETRTKEEEQKVEDMKNLTNIFSDLTVSVISTVYDQNEGEDCGFL